MHMINPHYDIDDDYHDGSPVEKDAKAWLGIWKSIDDVPSRYRLSQHIKSLDPDSIWEEFCDEFGENWSENTRKYQYGKGWREWKSFCDENGIHPLCPESVDVEEHLSEQRGEASSDATLHQTRFRPLCRLFEYMRYSVEYPHRYNPWIMAVLDGENAAAAWKSRIDGRITN